MTRRASLPGAEELFRPTAEMKRSDQGYDAPAVRPEPSPVTEDRPAVLRVQRAEAPIGIPGEGRATAAKPRHDEKITFYCTGPELNRLESARLALRAEHRLAADRGRIVRAALAEALEEFEAKGSSSALFRRLKSR